MNMCEVILFIRLYL